MNIPPNRVVLLGLIALVPAGLYAYLRQDPIVVAALVNVLLIVGALVLAMSETNSSVGNGTGASHG